MRSIAAFFLVLFIFASAHAEVEEKINVLYLNSYNNGYAWSDNIFEGIREKFQKSGKNIYLQVEYMDSKRYEDEKLSSILFDYYKYKFRSTDFDLIVVSDNHAYDFIPKSVKKLH